MQGESEIPMIGAEWPRKGPTMYCKQKIPTELGYYRSMKTQVLTFNIMYVNGSKNMFFVIPHVNARWMEKGSCGKIP